MGEIADLMLDGSICEGCGVTLPGDAPGHTRLCRTCQHDRAQPAPDAKVACKTCGRRVKAIGLKDHMRAAHKA